MQCIDEIKAPVSNPNTAQTTRDLGAFLQAVNRDVLRVNDLIQQYNQLTETSEQINQIKRIYQAYLHFEQNSNGNDVSACPDFHIQIHVKLYSSMLQESKRLGVELSSLVTDSNQINPPSATTPDGRQILSDFIANMAPEKLAQLTQLCWSKSRYHSDIPFVDTPSLFNLYSKTDPEYQTFITFLQQHTISLIGGRNALNYKITPLSGGDPFVLKFDKRFGNPTNALAHLLKSPVRNVFTSTTAGRQTTITVQNITTTIWINICDYLSEGDILNSLPLNEDNRIHLMNALSIYTQMATILGEIQANRCFFPDTDNTNWLRNKAGFLKVSDTKSIVFQSDAVLTKGNEDRTRSPSPFITKRNIVPPPQSRSDQNSPLFPDEHHAYALGVSLYEYLSAFTNTRSKSPTFSFSAEIFKTTIGTQLRNLIIKLIDVPNQRISITNAISELNCISRCAEVEFKKLDCFASINRLETLLQNAAYKYPPHPTISSLNINALLEQLRNLTTIVHSATTANEIEHISSQLEQMTSNYLVLLKDGLLQYLTKSFERWNRRIPPHCTFHKKQFCAINNAKNWHTLYIIATEIYQYESAEAKIAGSLIAEIDQIQPERAKKLRNLLISDDPEFIGRTSFNSIIHQNYGDLLLNQRGYIQGVLNDPTQYGLDLKPQMIDTLSHLTQNANSITELQNIKYNLIELASAPIRPLIETLRSSPWINPDKLIQQCTNRLEQNLIEIKRESTSKNVCDLLDDIYVINKELKDQFAVLKPLSDEIKNLMKSPHKDASLIFKDVIPIILSVNANYKNLYSRNTYISNEIVTHTNLGKNTCRNILQRIKELGFGNNDTKMNTYVQLMTDQIMNTTALSTLLDIEHKLVTMEKLLNNPSTKVIKSIIKHYQEQETKGCYFWNRKNCSQKADKINLAACAIELVSRTKTGYENQSISSNLFEALKEGRYCSPSKFYDANVFNILHATDEECSENTPPTTVL